MLEPHLPHLTTPSTATLRRIPGDVGARLALRADSAQRQGPCRIESEWPSCGWQGDGLQAGALHSTWACPADNATMHSLALGHLQQIRHKRNKGKSATPAAKRAGLRRLLDLSGPTRSTSKVIAKAVSTNRSGVTQWRLVAASAGLRPLGLQTAQLQAVID